MADGEVIHPAAQDGIDLFDQYPSRLGAIATEQGLKLYATVYRILTHPAYGGAYAYGKTETISRFEKDRPRKATRRKPREQWLSLIPKSHEGYVSWEQFDAADPENRLVADELELRWNQALGRAKDLERRIEEHVVCADQTVLPAVEDFEDLVAELEGVWNNPGADARLKKRIVRTLIHEVVVDVDSEAGEIILVIHWKGGVHTELRLPRRRRGQNSSQTPKEIVGAIHVLVRICRDDVIAGILNRNGLRTGRSNRWTRERVTSLRSHHQIPCYSEDKRLTEGWMHLTQASRFLGISPKTLRLAVERGEIEGEHPLGEGPWVIDRRELESEAAAKLVERTRRRRGIPALPTVQQQKLHFSTT